MFSAIKKSFFGTTLILVVTQLHISAAQTEHIHHSPFHPHHSSPHFSYYSSLQYSQPKIKESDLVVSNNFEQTSGGVWLFSNTPEGLKKKDFDEIQSLLKNPTVKYVVLDARENYNPNGDKIIRNNMSLVKIWYQDVLSSSSLKEEEIYKLVWLPKEKVINDLMNQTSFWPEEWLISMKVYWS